MSRHLLLLTCMFAGRCFAGNSTSVLSRIPDTLQRLCPGINICPENQTYPAPEYTFFSGYVSCCSECSCSSDCNENGNCCFPHIPKDDGRLKVSHTCLFPVTPQPPKQDRQLYQSYSMISSIPEKDHGDSTTVPNTSCGEENVAHWGSLYPVYSAEYKLLYKNMACAAANGVTDGMLWDAVLNCDDYFHGIKLDVSNFVLGLDSNYIPDECVVNFVYRGNIEDIKSLKCYTDVITTCLDSHFKIPDEAYASEEDIIEMCTSGLVSPFKSDFKIFANVFCFICNNHYFRKEMECPDIDYNAGRGPKSRGLQALLDGNFMTKGWKESTRETGVFPVACSVNDKGSCRPVHCPSGQQRARSGECMYPHKLWYDQDYIVCINLTTDTTINVTDVFKIQPGSKREYLPPFISPWPKDWFIFAIFSHNDIWTKFCKCASFQFLLKRKLSASVQPKHLVQTVNKFAARDWSLQNRNSSLVFKSHISHLSYSAKDFAVLDANSMFFFGNNSKTTYRVLYVRGRHGLNKFHITKLYFCNQVELNPHEIILSPYNSMLFNKITKRHLYDGEFALVWSNAYEDVCARICIEDSEMYEISNHSGINSFSENYYVRLIFLTFVCCVVNGL
ncbi:uncharacterized protein LOC123535201 [Mercenaria mercenaria]|uniref:uncharacterized protein LOC123535201 n=1 Tax=Mercenaria mercenaria TaxID=6596 RepID=UPI00234F92B0|nr:uncharacterized protein LOC123535201 [Mercenaria mercenaria]